LAALLQLAETVAVNGALNVAVKNLVHRPIPRAYMTAHATILPGQQRSFYSGHSSLASCALAHVATVARLSGDHADSAIASAALMLLGVTVGVGRILAGMHFATDVIVGTAMGAAIGVGWPLMRLRSAGRRDVLAVAERGQPSIHLRPPSSPRQVP
jgi:membrane-associated phospholipid phosphatase